MDLFYVSAREYEIVPTIFVGQGLPKSVRELPTVSPEGMAASVPLRGPSVASSDEVILGITRAAFMVRGA